MNQHKIRVMSFQNSCHIYSKAFKLLHKQMCSLFLLLQMMDINAAKYKKVVHWMCVRGHV